MENHDDFHPDSLLQRAVEAVLREPAPGPLPPEQLAHLVAVVEEAAERPRPLSLIPKATTMKTILRLAVAATILVAVVGLVSWLVPSGGARLALADVAQALDKIHSATWKTTETFRPPQGEAGTSTGVGMFLEPSHERTEQTVAGVTAISIIDGQQNKGLGYDTGTKTAMAMALKNTPTGFEMGAPFLGLRETIAAAQKGNSKDVEQLGQETIDGRRAVVFRIPYRNAEMNFEMETKIWADPETSLPIRVERTTRGIRESHSVMSDFQVNVALDPALFSVDVPEGYTVRQTQLDFSKGPLSPLVEALGMAAEHNDGLFPPTLHGEQGFDGILMRAVAQEWEKRGVKVDSQFRPLPGQDPSKLTKEDYEALQKSAHELTAKLPAALASVAAITRHGDWHYAGKDIKLGTPDRPIFWCKFMGNYQVIYADLSVKEVAPQDAPKVPQTEGTPQPQ